VQLVEPEVETVREGKMKRFSFPEGLNSEDTENKNKNDQ
jgi:hypothetical protein